MKSESFLSLQWQLWNYHFDAWKFSERDRETNPYESSGLVYIFWRDKIDLYDEQIVLKKLNKPKFNLFLL